MRTRVTELVVLLLLVSWPPRAAATDCGCRGLELADLVEAASTIVLGEVTALHDAAGEPLAEVRVVDLVKGELPGDTLFYPVRSVSWDPEEGPKVGERALLLLEPDLEFVGTRAFWKALDRLRQGRPFLELSYHSLGRLPILTREEGGSAVVHLFGVGLPPEVLSWLPENAAPESPERVVDAWTLVEAVRRLVERPEPATPEADLERQ
jgi:hypothetical protein